MDNKTAKILFLFAILFCFSVFADKYGAKIGGPCYVLSGSVTKYKVVLDGLDDSYIYRVKWHDIVDAEAVSSGSYIFVKAPSGKASFTVSCDVDFADPGSRDGLLHSSAKLEVLTGVDGNKLPVLFGNVEHKTNSVKNIKFLRYRLVENLSAEGWKNMLVDYAKDMAKNAPNSFELETMRPAYRLKMNYDALEKLANEDVEAVKKANGGTNNLNWCWNLLKPYDGHGVVSCLDKHDFAGAWRKTDCQNGQFDVGGQGNSLAQRFFWFIGRAYAKDFWEEWYACWTSEFKRHGAREPVLEGLARDYHTFEVFLMPFSYEALNAGDETLLFLERDKAPLGHKVEKKEVLTWWEANKDAYDRNLSAEEGLEKALKNAESSIRYLETDPKEPEILKKWAEEIADYYKKPFDQREKDYWYYIIGDAMPNNAGHLNEIISEILKQSR